MKKTQNAAATYYLRSTVLGGQVVAELDTAGNRTRGYVYAGSSLMAVQQSSAVYWLHEDPVTKSKLTTDSNGNVVSAIELDPWGADTNRSSSAAFQPKKFTSYERDVNGSDEAMFRRYNRWHSRFDQPDPYDGSYSLNDPQSFNRYAYTQNDPVNFVDPSGLFGDPSGGDDVIRTYTWAHGDFPWDFFYRSLFMPRQPRRIEPPERPERPEPQKPQAPGRNEKEITDCQRFAAAVDVIANNSTNGRAFMDELARQFTSANNSSTQEMLDNAGGIVLSPRLGRDMLDSGFKSEFRDPGSNQARHFVGGLIAGYNFGSYLLARGFMNALEGGVRSTPDTRLNGVSTNMGAALRNQSPIFPNFQLKDVADAIRRLVCE